MRHRLLTILVLGVLTSALSLVALVQLLKTSTAQRVERAREGVTEEVERLALGPERVVEPSAAAVVGMRGGTWDGERVPSGLPAPWTEPLRAAIRASAAQHGRVVLETPLETPLGTATLIVAARPLAAPPQPPRLDGGGQAWAAYTVRPLPSLRKWQWIVVLLSVATSLLFATAVYAIVTMTRGARALHVSLRALATDLSAPIPRPAVRELGDVADGIARLAENLARAKSEEVRLGQELAQRERLAALGRVAAGVAHEVRNPLASIKLRLDLAAASSELPEVAERAISHASSEIARLDRLVADLLVVAGRASGPRARVSLGDLVRDRVETLSPWATERGVTLRTSGEASALADADAVCRAIDNLLRNAVEASPRDAEVDVFVETRADPRARELPEAGTTVVVRVEDHGQGVPAERAALLFEPFFTTKSEGTGLGLAICRAIARGHDGDATYTRASDTTRFELSLRGGGAPDQRITS